MTTQTKMNASNVENGIKRNLSWITAVILLAALALSAYMIISPAAEHEAAAVVENKVQRAFEADAARYEAMADFYKNETAEQRVREANTERYRALADFYNANVKRNVEADAARYTGLAAFYETNNAAEVVPALAVEAARYQGLAEYYTEDTGVQPVTTRTNWDHPRHSILTTVQTSQYLAANPELAVSSRDIFLAMKNELPESTFLAANPELSAVQRYSYFNRSTLEIEGIATGLTK